MSTAEVWQDSDAALVAELGALETQLHSTWAQMLSVVAEIDSRGTADGEPGVPAPWCEIHHVFHWADNCPTSVGNCVALCGRHHKLLHHSRWRIDMAEGIPEFHPPQWLGGPPRRNPLHLIPDLVRIR